MGEVAAKSPAPFLARQSISRLRAALPAAIRQIGAWVLIGSALGVAYPALLQMWQEVDPGRLPEIFRVVPPLAVIAGGFGPRRLARWFHAKRADHSLSRASTPGPSLESWLVDRVRNRPSSDWLVLAGSCVICAASLALSPWLATVMYACHTWLHTHFLWSDVPALLIRFTLICVVVGVPFALMGFTVLRAHLLYRPRIGWDLRATGWILTGTALGGGLILPAGLSALPPTTVLLSSAIPCLLAAMLAATSPVDAHQPGARAYDGATAAPLWQSQWSSYLRGGIVLVGACGWIITSVIVEMVPAWSNGAQRRLLTMLAFALGVLCGGRPRTDRQRSVGGFGLACAAAAVASMAAVYFARGGPSADAVRTAASCLVAIAALGFAASRGLLALLQRVAAQTSSGFYVTTRVLLAGVVLQTLGTLWNPDALWIRFGVATMAVTLLALGASWVACDPHMMEAARQRRLGAIGAMALIVLGLGISRTPTTAGSGGDGRVGQVVQVDERNYESGAR